MSIKRRTFTWNGDHLTILLNMTGSAHPSSTRLMPPISWLTSTGSVVKSANIADYRSIREENDIPEGCIEILVPRSRIESATSSLRLHGFSNEDMYRMLDKGPWALSFDMHRTLPKLVDDLKASRIPI